MPIFADSPDFEKEIFLMSNAALWPWVTETVPSDVHDILCVSRQWIKVVHLFTVVWPSWNTWQHSVYWTFCMWKLYSKNKFILLISSKFAVVSFLCCVDLVVLALFTLINPPYYKIHIPNFAPKVLPEFHIVRNKAHSGICTSI